MENGEERRLQRRVCINLPVAAKPIGWIRKKTALVGRTIDLALSGMQLRLEGKSTIKPGDPVEIRVLEQDSRDPVHLEGKVRWLAPVKDRENTFRVGVVLTELSLEDYNNWVKFLYCYLED